MLTPALDLIRGKKGEEVGPRIALLDLSGQRGGGTAPVSYYTRYPDSW